MVLGKIYQVVMTCAFVLSGLGCGYTFQNSHNPLWTKEGVQKVYIPPLVNNSYKAGVENLIYNNLVRVLSAHARVTLVTHPAEADALLQGTIQGAGYAGSKSTLVPGLSPATLPGSILGNLPTQNYVISTEYTATLTVGFSLIRRNTKPGKKGIIWSGTFQRSEPFPGSNQLDVPGTTSPIINESEFDRALSDLARNMMEDVHESMLAMF